MKEIKILIMSVGRYETNYTANYIVRIGGKENILIVLPHQFQENAKSYEEQGLDVFLYDEKKYINDDFEYFGFKPRNCGGIGRQGIAEATEMYGDDFLCFQLDDDVENFSVMDWDNRKSTTINNFNSLTEFIYTFEEFYQNTGIEIGGCLQNEFLPLDNSSVRCFKIFNNFIMRKGNPLNFTGFAALCSDDTRFNIYNNLIRNTPMVTLTFLKISPKSNQGDREDGNAPLYNSDCSWKKSFSLKMIFPVAALSRYIKTKTRTQFQESLLTSMIYPPISLEKDGKIVAKLSR